MCPKSSTLQWYVNIYSVYVHGVWWLQTVGWQLHVRSLQSTQSTRRDSPAHHHFSSLLHCGATNRNKLHFQTSESSDISSCIQVLRINCRLFSSISYSIPNTAASTPLFIIFLTMQPASFSYATCVIFRKSIITFGSILDLYKRIIPLTILSRWPTLAMSWSVSLFLADRTNGCASATVLCPSSSSVMLSTVAKRCVLEQKLLLAAYRKSHNEKSIGTKVNDLDLCLEVVSRSCQPMRHICNWISRKQLEIEAWSQETTNRK